MPAKGSRWPFSFRAPAKPARQCLSADRTAAAPLVLFAFFGDRRTASEDFIENSHRKSIKKEGTGFREKHPALRHVPHRTPSRVLSLAGGDKKRHRSVLTIPFTITKTARDKYDSDC